MLTPAQLLLVERLIAVFVAILATLANADPASPRTLSQILVRKAIGRLIARLEQMRDLPRAPTTCPESNPEAETGTARPARPPRTRRPRRTGPILRPPSNAEPPRPALPRIPRAGHPRKRTNLANVTSTHA